MSIPHLVVLSLTLVLFFTFLWLIQVRTKDASHVDVGWAIGLGVIGVYSAFILNGLPERRALVGMMAALWSLRLSAHLYFDRVRGRPEDGRYATLRAAWGPNANRNFFFFFQGQAVLDLILGGSFIAVASRTQTLGVFDVVGCGLWFVSIAGEAAADRQLAAFRALPENKGRVCRVGLWNWSRHPNYFFEWLIWLSYAAMAPGDPRAWVSPILMLFFLLRVTGIPATEAQAMKSRGDAYRKYRDEVSMFIPLPPRRSR